MIMEPKFDQNDLVMYKGGRFKVVDYVFFDDKPIKYNIENENNYYSNILEKDLEKFEGETIKQKFKFGDKVAIKNDLGGIWIYDLSVIESYYKGGEFLYDLQSGNLSLKKVEESKLVKTEKSSVEIVDRCEEAKIEKIITNKQTRQIVIVSIFYSLLKTSSLKHLILPSCVMQPRFSMLILTFKRRPLL